MSSLCSSILSGVTRSTSVTPVPCQLYLHSPADHNYSLSPVSGFCKYCGPIYLSRSSGPDVAEQLESGTQGRSQGLGSWAS